MIEQDSFEVNWVDLYMWCQENGKTKQFYEKLNQHRSVEKALYQKDMGAYINRRLAEMKAEDLEHEMRKRPKDDSEPQE